MAAFARRRLIGGILGLLVAAAGVTACSNENSVVAKVGSQTITVDELDKAVQGAYDDPVIGAEAKKQGKPYRLALLNLMVQNKIINLIAEKKDIATTPADVKAFEDELFGSSSDTEMQQQLAAQGQYYTVDGLHDTARQFYIETQLGHSAVGKTEAELNQEAIASLAAQSKTVDLRYVMVADEASASNYLGELQSGSTTIDALGAGLGPTADGAPQPTDAAQIPVGQLSADMQAQLKDAAQGSFVSLAVGDGTFILAQVVAVTGGSPENLAASAADQVKTQISQAGQKEAAKLAKSISIFANPRYGTLERPSASLPSITGSEPSTFKMPATKSTAAPASGLPTGA